MRRVGSADNITPRCSSAAYSSNVGAGKEEDEDTVEAFVNQVLHGKSVLVLTSDLQTYERKEIWPAISLADGLTSPLRAASQKHKNELVKRLKSEKYQCIICSMTVANLFSGRFGAVEVHSML